MGAPSNLLRLPGRLVPRRTPRLGHDALRARLREIAKENEYLREANRALNAALAGQHAGGWRHIAAVAQDRLLGKSCCGGTVYLLEKCEGEERLLFAHATEDGAYRGAAYFIQTTLGAAGLRGAAQETLRLRELLAGGKRRAAVNTWNEYWRGLKSFQVTSLIVDS